MGKLRNTYDIAFKRHKALGDLVSGANRRAIASGGLIDGMF